MRFLIIDGMNFMHRARSGFKLGPHPVMFNFMRSLRAQIEFHKADQVFYVLEGHPKHRHEEHVEYKANRILDKEDPDFEKKFASGTKFLKDADDVILMLAKCFPITIVRHPDFECDDVIHLLSQTLCDQDSSPNDKVTVISTDTDFIQTVQVCQGRMELYNPVTKKFIQAPACDYVTWKALKGDGSDNIEGIPGIGEKRATELTENPEKLKELLSDPQKLDVFNRNVRLITLHDFTDEELEGIENHQGVWTPDVAKKVFQALGFNSIVNDKSWKKFAETFQQLESKIIR